MSGSLFSHIRDRELVEGLSQSGRMSQSQMQSVMERQTHAYQNSMDQLRGQTYHSDLARRELRVRQSLEGAQLNQVDFGSGIEPDDAWDYWGQHLLVLNPEQPELFQSKTWRPQQIGLTLSELGTYLESEDLAHESQLKLTRQVLDPRWQASGPSKTGPYDFFMDADQKLVCLCDRPSGDVYLISTDNYQVSEVYTLRDAPSQNALLIESDSASQRLYFVDQHHPRLGILDYQEGMLEELDLESRLPVNLARHQDHLYLLIRKPQAEIIKLSLDTLQIVQSQVLPLPLFQDKHPVPANPFVISPDGKFLAVVLGANPDAELLWFDSADLSLLKRQVLAGQPRPALLCFGQSNPLQAHRKHLADLLVEEELIEAQELLTLFPAPEQVALTQTEEDDEFGTVLEIIAPEPKASQPPPAVRRTTREHSVAPAAEAIEPRQTSDSDQQNFKAALLYLSPIERLTSLPDAQAGETLALPEQCETDIFQILSGSFYQQHGVDLNEHPEVFERLKTESRALRLQLQDHEVIPVFISEILPDQDLKTALFRDSILLLLELKHTPERFPYDTPPTHCPECRVPIMGRWSCESCGLELLSPERAAKRKIASVNAQTWLPAGCFAISDVQSGRLLLVNTHKYNYVTWQMDFKNLPGFKQPWDMLWLEDLHFLITDRQSNRVVETDQSGRISWAFPEDPEASGTGQLKQPVKATRYHYQDGYRYLIVDQGNQRVVEVDQSGQIRWQFGVTGESGQDSQHLKHPTDVQFTHEQTYLITDQGNHRVLEIRQDQIVHTWGLNFKLDTPSNAQRLFNGNTLIIDAGNTRILEIDSNDTLVREVHYFKNGMDARFDMVRPLKMTRRENQNIVMIDSNRVMEIDLLSKNIVWFSFLHELKLDLELPTRLTQQEIKVEQSPAFDDFNAPDPETMPTIRRTLQKVDVFKDSSLHFYDNLEKHLKFRRFKAGELIIEAGQNNKQFFVIQSGQVAMLSAQEKEPTLTLEAGDSFGLMGLIYPEPRKTTMQALSECGLYILDKRDFDTLIVSYPEVTAAVRKLASERLVLARLRQTPKSSRASSRLQALLEKNKQQAHDRLSGSTPQLVRKTVDHQAHSITYTEIEQRVIDEAQKSGLACFELHITLSAMARMKVARVALIVSVLDQMGTLIRTDPSPEEILKESFQNEVILTILTDCAKEQVLEDLSAISDIRYVEVLSIQF